MTVGDATAGYRMAGIADGLGAYLNDKNELVLLMNHEFGNNAGIPRAHGAKGSFVAQWKIDPASLKVLAGQDLIKKAVLKTGPKELGRMCSADLPAVSAFYNPATGRSTMTRIFLNGEENGPTGRALAHLANGPEAGTSYELTQMKQASWENVLASPFAQDKTVLIGVDDTHPKANPRLGKIWHFDPSTRKLSEIAVHDAARFTKGAAGFLTDDEESSGVIEVTDLLTKASRRYADGRRYYLLNVQAHYATDAELVEGGQLVLLASPKK